MQQYGDLFARVYNQRWAGFANRFAPLIRGVYEETAGDAGKSLLDLCCGTGQLAAYFLAEGYRVTGLDLSPAMLHHARENNLEAANAGQLALVEGNAADFRLDETFGLVVSTYDALNHLPDGEALRGCFQSVRRALKPGGLFVFDLNTRYGLSRFWNGVSVQDDEDMLIVNRGIFDVTSDHAYTRITGFVRRDDGLYERFAETFYNVCYDLAEVVGWLEEAGFSGVYIAAGDDLSQPAEAPEKLGRAWFVAR